MTTFWLAPLHGITLYPFRNCLLRHTTEIKTAVTPFFPIQETAKLNVKKWKDLWPEHNRGWELIPQLIGNKPQDFVDTVKALQEEFGYTRFNWNIGCPMQPIVRKRRGCGLMPHPDMVEEVTAAVTSHTDCKFSIKMRLGLTDAAESAELIRRLNGYPLDFIVLHPRLGVQQYEGVPDLELFAERLQESKHELIYSGDINTIADFQKLQAHFPQVRHWMLGRGILQNPFLADEIVGTVSGEPANESQRKEKFLLYYDDLLNSLLEVRGEYGTLSNLKELWHYFAHFVHLPHEALQKLLRVNDYPTFAEKSKQHIQNGNL